MIGLSLQQLKPTRVHLATQGWWGASSHINIGYTSADPSIVRRQIISSQALVYPAKLSTCPDWYPGLADCEAYMQQVRTQSEYLGIEFSVMIDKGAGDFVRSLDYIRKTYFPSHAYSRQNGKYIVWSFGADTSKYKLEPDIILMTENHGDTPYAWPNGFAPDTPQAYLQRFLKDTTKSTFAIPCLWKEFDDHRKADPKIGSWGGKPRLMSPGASGWDLWNSLVVTLLKSGRRFTDILLATLNDYEERTRLEPFILDEYAALLLSASNVLKVAN